MYNFVGTARGSTKRAHSFAIDASSICCRVPCQLEMILHFDFKLLLDKRVNIINRILTILGVLTIVVQVEGSSPRVGKNQHNVGKTLGM